MKYLNHQNLSGNRIENLGDPNASKDAANKAYVDGKIIVCTYSDGTFSGPSIAQIRNAVNAGKIVLCISGARVFRCVYASSSAATFSSVDTRTIDTLTYSSSGVTVSPVELQPKLVSGTNIKTMMGESLLGSGDITPRLGQVVRSCHLTSNGLEESYMCAARQVNDIYIVQFDITPVTSHWSLCSPSSFPTFSAEGGATPDVSADNFQQGDTCIFVCTAINSGTVSLKLIHHSRLGLQDETLFGVATATATTSVEFPAYVSRSMLKVPNGFTQMTINLDSCANIRHYLVIDNSKNTSSLVVTIGSLKVNGTAITVGFIDGTIQNNVLALKGKESAELEYVAHVISSSQRIGILKRTL